MKNISKLKRGQKVELILKGNYRIEGTVISAESDSSRDDLEMVVYITLDNCDRGFFAHQSEIEEYKILEQKRNLAIWNFASDARF